MCATNRQRLYLHSYKATFTLRHTLSKTKRQRHSRITASQQQAVLQQNANFSRQTAKQTNVGCRYQLSKQRAARVVSAATTCSSPEDTNVQQEPWTAWPTGTGSISPWLHSTSAIPSGDRFTRLPSVRVNYMRKYPTETVHRAHVSYWRSTVCAFIIATRAGAMRIVERCDSPSCDLESCSRCAYLWVNKPRLRLTFRAHACCGFCLFLFVGIVSVGRFLYGRLMQWRTEGIRGSRLWGYV